MKLYLSVVYTGSILIGLLATAALVSAIPLYVSKKLPTLKEASVVMRRVLAIERGASGTIVEVEDARGTQHVRVLHHAARSLKEGDMLPTMTASDKTLRSPLELRSVGVDASGHLVIRFDAYLIFAALYMLGALIALYASFLL
jgi:hypothetical protein